MIFSPEHPALLMKSDLVTDLPVDCYFIRSPDYFKETCADPGSEIRI